MFSSPTPIQVQTVMELFRRFRMLRLFTAPLITTMEIKTITMETRSSAFRLLRAVLQLPTPTGLGTSVPVGWVSSLRTTSVLLSASFQETSLECHPSCMATLADMGLQLTIHLNTHLKSPHLTQWVQPTQCILLLPLTQCTRLWPLIIQSSLQWPTPVDPTNFSKSYGTSVCVFLHWPDSRGLVKLVQPITTM